MLHDDKEMDGEDVLQEIDKKEETHLNVRPWVEVLPMTKVAWMCQECGAANTKNEKVKYCTACKGTLPEV